jgi:hypothetical protein
LCLVHWLHKILTSKPNSLKNTLGMSSQPNDSRQS